MHYIIALLMLVLSNEKARGLLGGLNDLTIILAIAGIGIFAIILDVLTQKPKLKVNDVMTFGKL